MDEVRLAAPPITRDEWDAIVLPEAYRAEIVQGEMVLSPGISGSHARAQSRLFRRLADVIPSGYEAIWGVEWSFDVQGFVAMAPIPDLMVVRADFDAPLQTPPLLAIEVISPSDRRLLTSVDISRIEGKRRDYAAAGLADYLEVDVLGEEPVVRRYETRDGVFVRVDSATGDERLVTERPFHYFVVPSALIP